MTMETQDELEDCTVPSPLFMVSAFLAMEPPETVLSFARDFGGGSVTESVQSFIWYRCIKKADLKLQGLYVKRFIKKLIFEIESSGGVAMDEIYECYVSSMISLQDDDQNKFKVLKTITFLSPDESCCAKSQKLAVRLQSSVNMLEGDTGVSSQCQLATREVALSLYNLGAECCYLFYMVNASDRVLSLAQTNLGSGVGLVGICLAHVKASKVILTDGDLATLANMKANLELNQLSTGTNALDNLIDQNMAHCLYLPWESASENELHHLAPDIILGADIIYDPSCLPHLVRVLGLLLNCKSSSAEVSNTAHHGSATDDEALLHHTSGKRRVAYIASVIRNVGTFNCFLELVQKANLSIVELTQKVEVFCFLPYLKSYDRSSIHIFRVSS